MSIQKFRCALHQLDFHFTLPQFFMWRLKSVRLQIQSLLQCIFYFSSSITCKIDWSSSTERNAKALYTSKYVLLKFLNSKYCVSQQNVSKFFRRWRVKCVFSFLRIKYSFPISTKIKSLKHQRKHKFQRSRKLPMRQ